MSAPRTSLFAKLFRRTPKTIRNLKPRPRVRLSVTALEDRFMPAALLTASLDLSDHVLRVEGTDVADQIHIAQPGNGAVSVSGVPIAVTDLDGNTTLQDAIPEDQVARIEVNALGGDDAIYVENGGVPAPIPLVVNGGDGNNTIFVQPGAAYLDGGGVNSVVQVGLGNDPLNGGNGANANPDAPGMDVVVDPAPIANDAPAPGDAPVADGLIDFSGPTRAQAASDAIQAKYVALGGAGGFLGQPTADQTDALRGGRVAAFQGGRIYWSEETGAHEVHGAIRAKYDATASLTDAYGKRVQDILGLPTSDELPAANGGRVSHFQGGDIYALPGVGTYAVYGAIRVKYDATAAQTDVNGKRVLDLLGLPISDELPTAKGGRVSHFQGGDVYANLGVGAYVVYGAIKVKYNALGGPGGQAGLPTTDELAVPGGRVSRFQGADIYALPGVGVYEVHGAIRAKYNAFGGASSVLGLPITDEVAVAGGWYNRFQHGAIFASPTLGTFEVQGLIADEYARLGSQSSFLGFPTSDETDTYRHNGRFSTFQHGTIFFSGATGAHEVHGPILNQYASMGWEMSYLGFPTSDELPAPDGYGRISYFQNGQIYWSPQTGALASAATKTFALPVTTDLPLGGSVSLVLSADGNFTFRGHMHDSGFDNISYDLVVAVGLPSGLAITVSHHGHTDGHYPFNGGQHDDDWVVSGFNQEIKDHWAEIVKYGQASVGVAAQDTLAGGLQDLVADVGKEALKKAAEYAVEYLVA